MPNIQYSDWMEFIIQNPQYVNEYKSAGCKECEVQDARGLCVDI